MAVNFASSGAVIVGANAQGKTSILEAVCVLVRLHSPGSTRMSRMVKVDAGDDFATSLEVTRERRLVQAGAGPHRDEVRLTINGMAAADFASEGQQRTMALSMKLA